MNEFGPSFFEVNFGGLTKSPPAIYSTDAGRPVGGRHGLAFVTHGVSERREECRLHVHQISP